MYRLCMFIISIVIVQCCYGQRTISVDTLKAKNQVSLADSLIRYSYFNEAISPLNIAGKLYSDYALFEKEFLVREKIVVCLWRLGEFEKALNLSNNILLKIKKFFPENHLLEGRYYFELGTIFFLSNDLDSAIKNFEKSLSVYEKNDSSKVIKLISNAHLNLGAVKQRLGDYNATEFHYQKSLQIDKKVYGETHEYIVDHYYNIGLINSTLGHYSTAMDYYNKGLSILQDMDIERMLIYSDLLEGIGILKIQIGELEKAKNFLFSSLKHRINIYGASNPLLNHSYNNLGLVFYKKQDYDSSLHYFQRALKEYNKYKAIANADLAPIYEGIALNYLGKKDYDSAIYYQNLGISILKSSGYTGVDLPREIYLLGKIYAEKGDELLAKHSFQKSIQKYEKLFPENAPPYLAEPYLGLALIATENKDFTLSLSLLQKALSFNKMKNNSIDFSYKCFDKPLQLEILTLQAKTLLAKYKNEKGGDDLLSAIKIFERCIAINDNIYFSYSDNKDKINLQSAFSNVHSSIVEASRIAATHFNDKNYLTIGFRSIEKNKANTLKSIVDNYKANAFGGIPDSLLLNETRLKEEIAFYQGKLFEHMYEKSSKESAMSSLYEKKIFEYRNEYDALIKRMELNYSDYFQLKYKSDVISITEVQSGLTKDQVLIDYLIDDSNIQFFTIDKSEFEIHYIKRDTFFNNRLQLFIEALREPNVINHTTESYNQFVSSAQYLYDFLLKPVSHLIMEKDLIIIPDGSLASIPFEALLTADVTRENIQYESLPYLIKDHAIQYANSATTLFRKTRYTKKAKTGSILAFSPHAKKNLISNKNSRSVHSDLTNLTWTENEVKMLSGFSNSKVYYDTSATKKNFLNEADKYNILHISTHGIADPVNPMNSKIVFRSNEGDNKNDGFLHNFELFNNRFNAEMVVLGACNTGSGTIIKGDGVLNLAQGFFYAGCNSVVMSLWEANDRTSYSLMESFYQNLEDGDLKHFALRDAKLGYLKNATGLKAHPHFWSQFVISGSTDSISIKRGHKSLFYLLLGGGIFVLFLCYLFFNKKRMFLSKSNV